MRFIYFFVVTASTLLLYQNCAPENENFTSASCSGPACNRASSLDIQILGTFMGSSGLDEVDPSQPVNIRLSPNVNTSTGACIEFLPIYHLSDACDVNVVSYPIANHLRDWAEIERGVFLNASFIPLAANIHGVQANFYAQRNQDPERTRKSFRIKSVLEVPLSSLGDKSFHWYSSDSAGLSSVRKISRQNLPVYSNVFRLFGVNGFAESLEMCLYREGMDGAKPVQGHYCDQPGKSFSVTRDSFTNKEINGRSGHHSNLMSAASLPVSITRIETYVKKAGLWIQLSSVPVIP